MARIACLLTILCLSAALHAEEQTQEFNVATKGNVLGNPHERLDGVSIDAKADEFWGHADQKTLERREKAEGPYPKVTVTGSATTGPDGAFTIEVKVKLVGQRIPKVKWGKPPVETCYAQVTFTASKPGYVTRTTLIMVTPIEPINTVYLSQFVKAVTISGRAVSKSNSPLGDVKLYLASEGEYLIRDHIRPPQGPLPQAKTDKDGFFKFEGVDPVGSSGRMIIPDSENLAVDPKSPHWYGISLPNDSSELKVGDVAFWPAGGIKVTFLDQKGAKAIVGTHLEMVEPSGGRYLTLRSFIEQGVYEFTRLPEGRYQLTAGGVEDANVTIPNIEVKGAQVTALGSQVLIPPCNVTIKFEAPAGATLMDAQFRLFKLDGDWNNPRAEIDKFTGLHYLDDGTQSGQNTFVFERVPVGKYEIWIRAREIGTTSQKLEFSQRKETVTVKLISGVPAKVSMFGPDGAAVKGGVFFLHETSPAYALFHETKGESSKLRYTSLRDSGWSFVESAWCSPSSPFDGVVLLRPGKYVVLAYPEQLGKLVKTDLVVQPGKQIELRLEVKPAILRVALSQSKKAYAENYAYLVARESFRFVDEVPDVASWRPSGARIYSAKTDKKGEAHFDKVAEGEYVVLSFTEYRYASAFGFHIRPDEFSASLAKRFIRVDTGESKLKCELPAYTGTWLNVSVKWGQKSDFTGAVLVPSAPGLSPIQGFGGFEVNFGLVAKGKYECIIKGDSFRGRASLVQKVEVTKAGEQQLKVEPEWRNVMIKFAQDDLEDFSEAIFVLRSESRSHHPDAVTARLSPGNWTQFETADGDYVMTCCWKNKRKELNTVVEKLRVAGKNLTLDLKPKSDHGAIVIDLQSTRDSDSRGRNASRFRLMNAAGAEVALADAGLRAFYYGHIIGIPPGTYSLELELAGFEPLRLEKLTVTAGAVTKASAAPKALKALTCTFEAEGLSLQMLRSALITAYDSDNITLQLAEKPRVNWAESQDYTIVLTLNSIPAATSKISIKVAGYKELLVELKETETRQAPKLERE